MPPLLELEGISKSFGNVRALREVHFDLQAGEVHGLVGENGAGKSTLIKIVTGALAADEGRLRIQGADVKDNNPLRARRLGVAAIYQSPALFPDLTVAENIALGYESVSPWRIVAWRERRRHARALLDSLGVNMDVETPVRDLSMPRQQLIEIARALGGQARVLIMDEPTASLSGAEVEHLFQIIRDLKTHGVGIIYITHRLDELSRIADRVTALRDGERVATRAMSATTPGDLIRMMVGRDLPSVFPKRDVPVGDVVLEARGLASRAAGIHDIHLHVRAGEILGLAGLVGAGRTELAQVLFGLHPAERGEILVRGKRVHIRTPRQAVAHGIAYVPEDRRRHGIVLDMPIAANATLAILKDIATLGWLRRGRESARASAFVKRLGVKTPSVAALANTLSGGNQQKVALARWLATNPALLILDEPTQGIDIAAKAEIHQLIGDLAAAGMAILLISSELPEILGISDRVAVMHAGTIVRTLDRNQATPERVLEWALGQGAEASSSAQTCA